MIWYDSAANDTTEIVCSGQLFTLQTNAILCLKQSSWQDILSNKHVFCGMFSVKTPCFYMAKLAMRREANSLELCPSLSIFVHLKGGNLVNNGIGINYISTGAGFLPSTVSYIPLHFRTVWASQSARPQATKENQTRSASDEVQAASPSKDKSTTAKKAIKCETRGNWIHDMPCFLIPRASLQQKEA